MRQSRCAFRNCGIYLNLYVHVFLSTEHILVGIISTFDGEIGT